MQVTGEGIVPARGALQPLVAAVSPVSPNSPQPLTRRAQVSDVALDAPSKFVQSIFFTCSIFIKELIQ